MSYLFPFADNLFQPASTEPKTRCEKAWEATEPHGTGIIESYGVPGQIKTVKFTSAIHADVEGMFVSCEISDHEIHHFWLTEIDNYGFTFLLKEDIDDNSQLNIIESVLIPDVGTSSSNAEISFMNAYLSKYFIFF